MWMPVHDPHDPFCRSVRGAVQTGTAVTLRILTPRTFSVRDAFLCAAKDAGGTAEELPMRSVPAPSEGYDAFEATLPTDGYTGLIFYHFTLCKAGELPYWYGKMEPDPAHPDITGGIYNRAPVPDWQITVYAPQHVPAWFGEGVTYGIFPDRFARDETVPADRPLKPWGAIPDYRPSTDGVIRRQDCFGGNLRGIRGKLSYLASLGVETLYLNPIFEARSNHRYDTGDYERIDPLLGDEAEFRALCRDAHALGMHVLLDGVFSHTGADSRYFNAEGRYEDLGAAQSKDSPCYDWYSFRHWPDDYLCWWDVKNLPRVNKEAPSYLDYIIRDRDSIVRRWLRAGADGWRLDVADELPDTFLDALRQAARAENPEALILGEVWEDASNKVAYGRRRHYLEGRQLDGVMNYPLRRAILSFLDGGDALYFRTAMEALQDHYPPDCFRSLLNFLGTHDTLRILTRLGCQKPPETQDERAVYALSPAERARGEALERCASAILYAFPGSPMLFYGDEAGLEGFEDPFNRRCFPWGGEDAALLSWYRLLGLLRRRIPALRRGALRFVGAAGPILAFRRDFEGETLLCLVNRGDTPGAFSCPWEADAADSLLNGVRCRVEAGQLSCTLQPVSCAWLYGKR